MAKLTNLNAHYLRETPDAELLPLVLPRIEKALGRTVGAAGLARIERGMNGVKPRSRTVIELADNLLFYARDGAPPIGDAKARAQITPDSKALLARLATAFDGILTILIEGYPRLAPARFGRRSGSSRTCQ